ncbi:MAG: hypothetical protein HQL13_03135, partial [Candidatus Omnitrophica bacterium]|nr:hypothetical protein [Candidatus Omnitrophota bacterium]
WDKTKEAKVWDSPSSPLISLDATAMVMLRELQRANPEYVKEFVARGQLRQYSLESRRFFECLQRVDDVEKKYREVLIFEKNKEYQAKYRGKVKGQAGGLEVNFDEEKRFFNQARASGKHYLIFLDELFKHILQWNTETRKNIIIAYYFV